MAQSGGLLLRRHSVAIGASRTFRGRRKRQIPDRDLRHQRANFGRAGERVFPLARPVSVSSSAEQWLSTIGATAAPALSRGLKHTLPVGNSTWRRLSNELATAVPQPASAAADALPLEGLIRADDFFDLRLEDIPIYFVGRGVIVDALFSAPSRREIVRILQHFGYQLLKARGKGSHEVWEGPNNRAFTLPLSDP